MSLPGKQRADCESCSNTSAHFSTALQRTVHFVRLLPLAAVIDRNKLIRSSWTRI